MPIEDRPSPITIRSRVQLTPIQGVSVLVLNFGQASPSDSLEMLEELSRVFDGQPRNGVLILADLKDVSYDPSVSQKWKAALVKYSPYLKAAAVYGATGLAAVGTMAAMELMQWIGVPFAKGKIRLFKTKDKALEWLLQV